MGVDAVGIDLSPAMVELARRDHPGLRFEVGSMTELDLPDDEVPTVLGHFRRVLRPGGPLLLDLDEPVPGAVLFAYRQP